MVFGREISIDEMMVLTKSIFSPIKIRINAKLICDGMKILFLCDAKNEEKRAL
jgi:hypothetical protein